MSSWHHYPTVRNRRADHEYMVPESIPSRSGTRYFRVSPEPIGG